MATLAELEIALVNADKAGDADAARKLAAAITEARKDKANLIPGGHIPGTIPQAPELSLLEKTVGAGEAALTAVTGIAGTLFGGPVEVGNALLESAVTEQPLTNKQLEDRYIQGIGTMTYAPRTVSGQEQAQALGKAASNLIPLAGLSAEAAAISQAAKPATAQAVQAVKQGGVKAAATVAQSRPVQAVREAVGRVSAPSVGTPTPGTMGSAGAAATDLATIRQTRAESLPVPLKLTKGMRENEFSQQRFEKEIAKDGELGAPIRQRMDELNTGVFKNFDAWIDQTGAESPSLRDTGITVTKAIKAKADAVKTKIRALYKQAEEAGELENPIQMDSLVQHLNESAPEAATAPLIDVARRKLLQIGAAVEGDSGQLIAVPVPLKKAEMVRQSVSRATNFEPTNIRQGTIMKGLIDQQTEGLGGNLYKQARKVRAQYAREFENRATIADLLNNKRGMDDRKVAFEDVFKRSILDGSLDDVRMVRRTLQTQGDEGRQAWRELQGATVAHIKEQAFKNVSSRDGNGTPSVSAKGLDSVVKSLDKDGKLDFVFGKQGAQQLRDINDVAKDILISQPNAVNTSNTASVLLTALDTIATYGTTGVPVPAVQALKAIIKNVKQRKIKKQVQEALQ